MSSCPSARTPTSVYRVYDYDAVAIKRYVEATRTPEALQAYLAETVYGVPDHAAYLERIGGQARLSELMADPGLGY